MTRYSFLLVALPALALIGCSSKVVSTKSGTPPAQAPSAPAGLTATSPGIDRIDLSWVDTSNNELGFLVESAAEAGGPFAAIRSTAADVTSFTDDGLEPGTARFYRVSAFNDRGSSPYSNVATATTAMDVVVSPGSLVAKAVSSGEIDLTWEDASSNEQGFRVEGAGADSGPFTLLVTTEAGATSYAEKNLAPTTTRFYRVSAFDAFTSSQPTASVSATTWRAVPPAPQGLSVVEATESTLQLAWTDASETEDGFVVERATAPEGPFAELARLPANTVTELDKGLAASTSWSYRVGAFNESGTSYSDVATGTTLNRARGIATFHEVTYAAFPQLGKGLLAQATFGNVLGVPDFEDDPASVMGCKAWKLAGPTAVQADFGLDAGALTFDGATLKMPGCSFVPNAGYLCPWAAGTGGTISDVQFEVVGETFGPEVVGSYLLLDQDILTGAFYPIAQASGPYLLSPLLRNHQAGDYSGSWVVLAGRGPAPVAVDPGDLIQKGARITVSLARGLGSLKPFDAQLTSGDPFLLDAASASLISSLPLDGSEFTLQCNEKACGKAQVSALILDTTNSTVFPGAPFFPIPSNEALHVECISSGTSVSVPKEIALLLSGTNLTRVRAEFFRSGLEVESDTVPVLAGHGVVGFTDR